VTPSLPLVYHGAARWAGLIPAQSEDEGGVKVTVDLHSVKMRESIGSVARFRRELSELKSEAVPRVIISTTDDDHACRLGSTLRCQR